MPPAWVEAVQTAAAEAGLTVTVQVPGTVHAQNAFERAEVDLIVVGQVDVSEATEGVQSMAYAFQLVRVVVPEANPLQTIDYRQLREIFGDGGRGDQWGRYVEGGAWRSRPVQPLAVRHGDHLSFEIFSQHALEGRVPRSNVRFFDSSSSALNQLRNEIGGIALIPSAVVGDGLRVLAVAPDAEQQAYPPSAENVLFGDYAMRLPFYLHWRDGGDAAGVVSKLLEVLLSDTVLSRLEAEDWMPLPERERQAYLEAFAD